jgi:hypothetical protein
VSKPKKTRNEKSIEMIARSHAVAQIDRWRANSQLGFSHDGPLDEKTMGHYVGILVEQLVKMMVCFEKYAHEFRGERLAAAESVKVTLPSRPMQFAHAAPPLGKPVPDGDIFVDVDLRPMRFQLVLSGAHAFLFHKENGKMLEPAIRAAEAEAIQLWMDELQRNVESLTGTRDDEYWDRREMEE